MKLWSKKIRQRWACSHSPQLVGFDKFLAMAASLPLSNFLIFLVQMSLNFGLLCLS